MLDGEHPSANTGHGAPVTSLEETPAAVPPPTNTPLARLLAIADSYRAGGNLRQAMAVYFALVDNHPDTAEGRRALTTLLDIGAWYERHGDFHLAQSLYERLL